MADANHIHDFLGPFFKHGPVMQFCFDDNGTVVAASDWARDNFRQVFGKDIMEMNVLSPDVMLPAIVESVKNHKPFRAVVHFNTETKTLENAYSVRLLDNNIVSFFLSCQPLRDGNGDFLAHHMLLREITVWQREAVRNRIASEKLDMLTEQLGIAHFNYSPKDGTCDVFGGRDKHWLVGVSIDEVVNGIVHPDDRAKVCAAVCSVPAKAGGKKFCFSARMMSNVMHCYRLFNCELIPQFHEDGTFAYYAGYAMDVTDQVDALKKQKEDFQKTIAGLRQDKAVAEEKEQGMGDMLSCMGHDLRSPLGTISGFAELMLYSDSAEEKAEYYKVIKNSVEQMSMLVNDILEANRLDTGRMKFRISTFDVEDMLGEVYQSHKLRFAHTDVDFRYEPKGQQVCVESDLQRVIEVLGNYIGNAIKYTDKGHVTISYEETGDGVCLHVMDTGRGIAPENHKKAFERFEMLGSEVKGNGLGLYICREIAAALGGKVGVKSELGRGSDFWLWLPFNNDKLCNILENSSLRNGGG